MDDVGLADQFAEVAAQALLTGHGESTSRAVVQRIGARGVECLKTGVLPCAGACGARLAEVSGRGERSYDFFGHSPKSKARWSVGGADSTGTTNSESSG